MIETSAEIVRGVIDQANQVLQKRVYGAAPTAQTSQTLHELG
jgi:hypothetical protein